jgi:hypothetical protein
MKIKYKDKAWLILKALNDFGPQRREQIIGNDPEATAFVREMMLRRLLRLADDNQVDISPIGRRRMEEVIPAPEYACEMATSRTYVNSSSQGTYDGRELGRTCHRSGAYDAFELPSLIGGQRIMRRFA